jgi:uncharacterized protein
MDFSSQKDAQLFNKILDKDLSGVEKLIIERVDVNQFNKNSLSTPLIESIKLDWLEGVKLFINAGSDVHQSLDCEPTPLGLAVNLGKLEIVKLLLKAGASPNHGGIDNLPLHSAVAFERIDIVRTLIEAGASLNSSDLSGETPLMIAAYKNNLRLVKLLIESGASANIVNHDSGETVLVMAAANGHQEVFEYLLPLTSCPQQQKYALIELSQGILRNQRREDKLTSSLIKAVSEGDIKTIQEVIMAGVDINALGEDGRNALHVAAFCGNSTAVHALLAAGANPEIKAEDDGWTPMMVAVLEGHVNIVAILIEAGDNPNLCIENMTPLMLASDANRPEVIKFLLKAGVDVNAQNSAGKTALFFAQQNGYTKIIELLREAGAAEDGNDLNVPVF